MMDQRAVFLTLLLLNVIFWTGLYHMDLNFFAKSIGQKITGGAIHVKTEDAYRYSSYVAGAVFILTDVLFIWAFLK